MESKDNERIPASSQRRWSTSEGIALGANPPTGWARGIERLQRIQDMTIAPEHEAKVGTLVRDCVQLLKEAASRQELDEAQFDRETAKLMNAIRFGGFLVPPVKVDEMTKKGAALALIYSSGEVDIIRSLVADGSKIEDGFDTTHIVIGGRVYSRYSLREAGRPQSWTNIASWHSQFPMIEEKKRA